MNVDDFNDFRLQCRTCLQTDHLTSIYESKAAQMLHDCNFCNVSENDNLPAHICIPCLQKLEQCYSFKQQCKQSETTLRNALNRDRDPMSCTKNEIEYSLDTNDLSENLDTNSEELISFLDKPLPPPLPYQCQRCTHSFHEENDLKIHQSIHNPELICLACHKQFTGRQTLKRHLKIHLLHKPHLCKICSKSFSESYALVKHLRHHSGIPREKRHICEECGQRFSEPYYLKLHMRKHTGERPLVCSICDKRFADPRSLRTHVMIHTGDKPHICNVCAKGFTQVANLKKHLRVHTGEKPHLCKVCGKKFAQCSTLRKHLRTHGEGNT